IIDEIQEVSYLPRQSIY
ncbi:hypothetical protein CP082626L3_0899B, partial [Chlamydia psittaci 08-2626_L3]